MAKETILKNFNQFPELPASHSVPQHPDSYRPESIETEKRNSQIEESSNQLIQKLFTSLSAALGSRDENKHLNEAQYGENVDIRAYWKRCGFKEANPRGAVYPDNDVIRFQFEDKAAFQIKCSMPLKPVYSLKEAAQLDFSIAKQGYAPSVYKIFANHILPMQTPGLIFTNLIFFSILLKYAFL